MLTEDIGLALKQSLAPMVDVREFELISTDEFEASDATKPEWYQSSSDRYILKLEILTPPEKHIVKAISDICHHTRSQVYIASEYESTVLLYICPTENEFEALYNFLGNPEPSRLAQ